ncbi:MAG: 4Fe-4S binding protein [candidate division Zixibacteria bacterium]|nr:4Fe-4S binding protein [candidate division Zixibacteria bacterium]
MKRRLFQIGTLVVSNSYIAALFFNRIYQGPFKGVCVPVMNCYGCPLATVNCPIGTLQHFVIIKAIPFMLIGFFGVIGLVVGRMTCGWLCPFGFFQEMLYKIKTKKFYPRKGWSYSKYVVLAGLTLLVAFWVGEPWFCKLCPVGTLEAGIPFVLWNPTGDMFTEGGTIVSRVGLLFYTKLFILFALVGFAILVHQPFCRYACPMGAIWSLFNKFSIFKLKVRSDVCAFFEDCHQGCPMEINVHHNANDGDCIRCLECTKWVCKTVKFKPVWKEEKIEHHHQHAGSHVEHVKEGRS